MLEDNDFLEKLNKQSYTSSTQQSPSLTVEDLQRTVNDLKEKYGDIQDRPYRPMLPSNDVVVNAFSAPVFGIAYQNPVIVQSQPYSMMRPIAINGTDEGFNLEDHIKDTNIALQSSITADDILHLLETMHDNASKEAPMFIVPLNNYKKIKAAFIKSQRPHGVVLRKSVLRRINKRQKQQINKVNKALKKYEASPMYNEGRQCK